MEKLEHKKNFWEYFGTVFAGRIKQQKTKGKERLICPGCENPFPIDINGDHALVNLGHSGVVIIKFSEIAGICQTCLSKNSDFFSWISTRKNLKRLFDDFLISEALNKNPKLHGEYNSLLKTLETETLEIKFKNAIKKMGTKNITTPETRLRFLKEELSNTSVDNRP